MPANTNLLVMVSENDHIVGDKIGKLVFNTASKVKNRNLIRQYSDYHNGSFVSAHHNESYSVDKDFDSGLRNGTVRRAMRISRVNAVDYYGYWKLFDALNAYTRSGTYRNYAFGNTAEQKFLGAWGDGSPIRKLEVKVPDNEQGIAEKIR